MRSDMSKVLVERPRLGHGMKNHETRMLRRSQKKSIELEMFDAQDDENLEESEELNEGDDHSVVNGQQKLARTNRSKIKPTRSMNRFFARKDLNENLRPLERFLYGKVGKQWDSVFAELNMHINKSSAVQAHVLQHIPWMVTTSKDINFCMKETPYGFRPYRENMPVRGLFVDNHGYLRDGKKLFFPEDAHKSQKAGEYQDYPTVNWVTKHIDGADHTYKQVLFCQDLLGNWWLIRTETIRTGSWQGVPTRHRKWEPGDADIIDNCLPSHMILQKFSYELVNLFDVYWRRGIGSEDLNSWRTTGTFPMEMWQASKEEIADMLFLLKKIERKSENGK